MKEIKVEHLAYLLKQAKEKKQSQPIFFLGAGASRSGKIPLAGEIKDYILKEYAKNPSVRDLPAEERTYARLMDCLLPAQRDELLKKYIDEAKINVTHIYLAQLLKNDFVDYVLTVNFDNLMLRALALYNIFPATYDMAILKDLTTTTFKEKSVVYLHGQNHGLWLLNTPEEMEKVRAIVPRIFDSIKNKRPWVFIGYSGDDPIFEHIQQLGRFDNGLYWITYNDNDPNKSVLDFLCTPNTNAFIIKGYDADAFMLKLNAELRLPEPTIVDKPFTALQEMLNEIIDIDEKEHFKGVKERLEISKKQVQEAIQHYEVVKLDKGIEADSNPEIDLLKKEVINLLITNNYDKTTISRIEAKAMALEDKHLLHLIASLFYNWGTDLGNLAATKSGQEAEALYREAFEKYQKAIDIKPDKHEAFNNWGNNLGNLAAAKSGQEADALYREAFEKYQKAIDIKPDKHEAFYNWGNNLGDFAAAKSGQEAEALYREAFEKYQKAIDIKPDKHEAFNNWGADLGKLAATKSGQEAEALYREAFEKYQKAIDIRPDNHDAFNNWGANLGKLAAAKSGQEADALYREAFEKYQKAIDIKPDKHEAFYNWGNNLGDFAAAKSGQEAEALYREAFEKYQKAIDIKPDKHEAFNNWGADLGKLAATKSGQEAEALYREAFEKYQKAIDIRPDEHEAFYNWGNYLIRLAAAKSGQEAEALYNQAIEKLLKSIDLGGRYYNLACLYAIRTNKEKALYYLDISLSKKEVDVSFVQQDEDWKTLLDDVDFIAMLNKYRNIA